MAQGTGFRRFVNRAPALPQGPAIISAGEGGDAAFRALQIGASQLGAVAHQDARRRIDQAESVYIAKQDTQITNHLIKLRDQYHDDPAGYEQAVKDFRSATVSSVNGQSDFVVERVGILIDQKANAQLSGISAARRAKEDRQARSVFSVRLEQEETEILDLVSTGQIGSAEFFAAQQRYSETLNEFSNLGHISKEQAALQEAALQDAVVAGSLSFEAEAIYKEQGLQAALKHVESFKSNENAGLSLGSRLKVASSVEDKLRGRNNSDQARARSLRSANNTLANRYLSGKPVPESAHVEMVETLKQAGLWQEIAILNQARVRGDIAKQASQITDLEERSEFYQRTLEELRTDGAYQNPIQGEYNLSSRFGLRFHPIDEVVKQHNGIDIPAPHGTQVVSVKQGTVVFAAEKGGFGHLVIVQHADGAETEYAHLSAFDAKVGDVVDAGTPLGKVGSTGKSTGSHLHYGVKVNGSYVDPEVWAAEQGSGDPAQTPLYADVQRTFARELRAIWKPMDKLWDEEGIRPTNEELEDLLEEARLAGAEDIIDQVRENFEREDLVQQAEGLTPEERINERRRLKAKSDEEGLSRIEANWLLTLNGLQEAMFKAAKVSPVGAWIEYGNDPAPAVLDFGDPGAIGPAILERQRAAKEAARFFGLEGASIFLPHEKERLTAYWDHADANQRSELLGHLSVLDGPVLISTLAEIASDRPSLAIAAAMYGQRPGMATAIVRGETALELDSKLVPKAAFQNAFNERAQGVFAGRPSRNDAMMGAVLARYADLVNGSPLANQKEINSDVMDQAFADVIGQVGRDWAGGGFLLPPDMTPDEASNILANLDDDDLEGAVTGFGIPVTVEDLRDGGARLLERPTQPGTYNLDLKGTVLDDSGGLFILDLAEIGARRPEALEPRRAGHFFPFSGLGGQQ